MPAARFSTPREIYYGQGALEALRGLEATRAFVVTDATMVQLGFVKIVRAMLSEKDIECCVFDEVEQDPSRGTVDKGLTSALAFKPDLFVALGGGSPIDAAKAIWVRYEHPDLDWETIFTELQSRKLRGKARFVAIPSTSGTGSEVTAGAVITNRSVTPAVKRAVRTPEQIPDVAIVDPDLTVAMPPQVTANTGFDALSHAVEAYVSTGASDLTDGLAIKAIQLVFEWLPKAVANGQDITAREKMHNASLIAGMAFCNARLGIGHALAHQLGSVFGIPHGRANAFVLSHVIAFTAPVAAARYAEIARALDLPTPTAEEGTRRLISAVRGLQRKVGIPLAIKDDGLAEEAFMAGLEAIAQQAMNDSCVLSHPREPNVEVMRSIYLAAWRGDEPA